MRKVCQVCQIKSLTQGSIFNAARNEDYGDFEDLGVLISARCDIANSKGRKFSYLPVVSLEKFFFDVLFRQLLSERRNDEMQKIKQLIRKEGIHPDLLDVYGVESCLDTLPLKDINSQKAMKCLELYREIESVELKSWEELKESTDYVSDKSVKKKLKDLTSNKIEGYHFLDEVVDFNDNQKDLGAHVILMREVHHIESRLALALSGDGVSHDFIDEGYKRSLVPVEGGFSCILCNIKSPHIELIMQRFSHLYSRIGVEDPSKDLPDQLAKSILRNRE